MTDAPIAAPSKLDRYAPLVAGLLLAAPTLLARYLPMSDLPMHEGVIGLLRHFGDPEYMPDGLYVRNLGHPNQLFHVSAWLLSYIVSTSAAVRIVVALAQVFIFVGGARLADHLGRSRWGVLMLTPLALGFTFYWGLVANLIGYAGFLFALPIIDDNAARPTVRNTLKTCAMLLFLFFAHESIFVSAAAIIGIFALLRPVSLKESTLRILPSFFAAGVALLHVKWQAQFFTPGQAQAPVSFMKLSTKLTLLPNVLFGSHDLFEQLLVFATSLVACALLFSGRVKDAPVVDPTNELASGETATRLRRARAFLWRFRFEAVAFIFLVAYFAVPFNWKGATLIHERFLGPAWAIFVIAAAPRELTPRIAKVVAAVVPLGVLLLSWPQFADADYAYKCLDELVAQIPKGRAVTLTALDKPLARTRVYSASTLPARIVAARGGRVGLSLTLSPISPVQMRPEWRWDEYDVRTMRDGSKMLKPSHDLKKFEWLVAQSRDPETRDLIKAALKPDAQFIAEKGEWQLYRSRYEVAPLKSPDVPAPRTMETALDRVFILSQVAHGERDDELPPELRGGK